MIGHIVLSHAPANAIRNGGIIMFELTPFGRHRSDIDVYDPFRDLALLEDNFLKGASLAAFKTDIKDTGDSYVLEADLPGFKKEDIDIDIDGNYLTISAERHSESEEKDKEGNYVKRERSYGSFVRSFDISSIKSDDIDAEYSDGVLKLTMPKKEAKTPATHRLAIK